MKLTDLLTRSIELQASDLHLSTGLAPLIRVDGELKGLDFPSLGANEMQAMLDSMMTEEQKAQLVEGQEIDFCYEPADLGRFRVNVFQQSRGLSAALRLIPSEIASLDELGLPATLKEITTHAHGLVLVTGPTGSGKSTTLAAMIDLINQRDARHILSIEDPIEFIHKSQKCLIQQREVHRDTQSFQQALRAALREDPDVILIGEMRDLETIRLALTAAETGHLVFATLHTGSATKAINRIVDVFPSTEQNSIRAQLAESLQAVIAQRLVKKLPTGRCPLIEIMICNPAIRNLIREGKTAQMYSVIQTNQASGMQTFEQHQRKLVAEGVVEESSTS